jgi:hypothetical protein
LRCFYSSNTKRGIKTNLEVSGFESTISYSNVKALSEYDLIRGFQLRRDYLRRDMTLARIIPDCLELVVNQGSGRIYVSPVKGMWSRDFSKE